MQPINSAQLTSKFSIPTIVDNSTVAWDIITITFVTLGVANLDTTKHSLNQLFLTTNKLSEDYGLKSENLTSEADFPLILSPLRYWVYDLSCSPCQSLTFSLEVDGEWFKFAPNQLLSDAGFGNTYWPPHWSEVLYYTVSNFTQDYMRY